MIYTIIAIITACLAVFTIAVSIQAVLAGYAIGWVTLACTLVMSWFLITDGLDNMAG